MCLAVISNQFSLTKQREFKRMMAELSSRNTSVSLTTQIKMVETQITSWESFIEYLEILILKALQKIKVLF
jgi:hypothetical protein